MRDLERRFFSDPVFFPSTSLLEGTREVVPISSNLTEDEKNYYLTVELPGMDKEKLRIEAGEKFLKIFGERKEETKEENT